ncbi:MAG: POTRA domain-containing protein [Kofleriaceae bacterium]
MASLLAAVLLGSAGVAWAQADDEVGDDAGLADDADGDDADADADGGGADADGAADDAEATIDEPALPPVPGVRPGDVWTEWALQGRLLEDAATVRAMLEPELLTRRVLNDSARADLAAACARLGYQLVELTTESVAGGAVRATLTLDPIPLVRSVRIDLDQSLFDVVLDDQILRRLQLGPGTYLPWAPEERARAIAREVRRIEEYLQDEGFLDARVRIRVEDSDLGAVRLYIKVVLGEAYEVGRIGVDTGGGLAVSEAEIRATFRHRRCLVWPVCWGNSRFTRAQLRADVERLTQLYQRRGYPAARVQSDYDPRVHVRRDTKTVDFTIIIDQRRQLDVVFEGNDPEAFPDATLRDQLTFNQAASSDDLEAADSAAAIAAYYQRRGRFDTQVSWSRERFTTFDRIVFRIDAGPARTIRSVTFVGNRALSSATLAGVVATKAGSAGGLLGGSAPTSGELLAADAQRIEQAYRARGYLEAKARVGAGPTAQGAEAPALAAALVAAERKPGELHVRFEIDEGQRTEIGAIELRRALPREDPGAPERCASALARAASHLGMRLGPVSGSATGCRAVVSDAPLDPSKIPSAGDAVREFLWNEGRPDAEVEATIDRSGPRRHHAVLELAVNEGRALTIGKVIVRGSFRTRRWLVLRQLGFTEGAPITAARLAAGPEALRSTGLFDTVTVELVSGQDSPEGVANFVVRVRERNDARVYVDGEAGISTLNGLFGKAKFTLPNLFGLGLSTDLTATLGTEYQALEGTARIPRWLIPPWAWLSFDTDLLGFIRRQQTARFGQLYTQGVSVAASRTFERSRTATRRGRIVTLTARYDYRLRNRDEDALRAAGPDSDLDQVPVATRTGSVGGNLRWDQRYDRDGNINPLAPERGVLLEADASLASPLLGGSDLFVKLSATAKHYQPLGAWLTLRTELRADQGIPLGGAVLLPEVERFFGGGDDTVRGYEEDRLATEVIEVGVPPLAGVSQIKVVPRGGNVRALGSLDLELRLWRKYPIASAVFLDAGFIRNEWRGLELADVRPAIGVALARLVLPIGSVTVEYAIPLDPRLGDDPRGRWHWGIAMRL